MRRCKAVGSNGPCRAAPQVNSEYCFLHDPSRQPQARAAQSKGGSKPHLPLDADGVVRLLSLALKRAMNGTLSEKQYRHTKALGSLLLKALGLQRRSTPAETPHQADDDELERIIREIEGGERSRCHPSHDPA